MLFFQQTTAAGASSVQTSSRKENELMSDVVKYGWLKVERAFRMEVKEAGHGAREIVPVGEQLYDPQLMARAIRPANIATQTAQFTRSQPVNSNRSAAASVAALYLRARLTSSCGARLLTL
jgi:hypothetical protein